MMNPKTQKRIVAILVGVVAGAMILSMIAVPMTG